MAGEECPAPACIWNSCACTEQQPGEKKGHLRLGAQISSVERAGGGTRPQPPRRALIPGYVENKTSSGKPRPLLGTSFFFAPENSLAPGTLLLPTLQISFTRKTLGGGEVSLCRRQTSKEIQGIIILSLRKEGRQGLQDAWRNKQVEREGKNNTLLNVTFWEENLRGPSGLQWPVCTLCVSDRAVHWFSQPKTVDLPLLQLAQAACLAVRHRK